MINYSVTKYLPLTLISVVQNMSPIIVIVLAFLILKEVVRKFDILMMLLTLVGIFGVIIGGDATNTDEESQPLFPMWVLYVLLLCNPFLSAGGTIAMKKMAKFSDTTVSWYLQWSIGSTSAIVMLIFGIPFTIYNDWDWISWLLAFLAGATSVLSSVMRFKALKLQAASAVQKLTPLTTIWTWIFDVTLFSVHYTVVQDAALGYLCLLYLI